MWICGRYCSEPWCSHLVIWHLAKKKKEGEEGDCDWHDCDIQNKKWYLTKDSFCAKGILLNTNLWNLNIANISQLLDMEVWSADLYFPNNFLVLRVCVSDTLVFVFVFFDLQIYIFSTILKSWECACLTHFRENQQLIMAAWTRLTRTDLFYLVKFIPLMDPGPD